eukprot:tig00020553_g10742.t1
MALHGVYAEYAKSGRASCKTCSNLIENRALRIGLEYDSDFFDGTYKSWNHATCAFKEPCLSKMRAFGISDAAQIRGFSDLRPKDQQALVKLMAAAGGAPEADGRGEEEEEGEDEAPPPKAKAKAAVKGKRGRKAKKEEEEDSEEDEEPAGKKPAGKRAAGSRTKANSKSKSKDVDGEGAKKEGEAASDALWRVKDELAALMQKGDLTREHLRAICRANGQPDGGGDSTLLGLVADGLVFGRIPSCPACNGTKVVHESGAYRCRGAISEWTACTWVGEDMDRRHYEVPDGPKLQRSSKKQKKGGKKKKRRRRRSSDSEEDEDEEEVDLDDFVGGRDGLGSSDDYDSWGEAESRRDEIREMLQKKREMPAVDPVYAKIRKLAPEERLKPAKAAAVVSAPASSSSAATPAAAASAVSGSGSGAASAAAAATSSPPSASTGPLAGKSFAWAPTTGVRRDREALQTAIVQLGAVLRGAVGPHVSFLIVGNEYDGISKRPSQVCTAEKHKVPLVREAWIDEMLKAGALVDQAPFILAKPGEHTGETTEEDEPAMPAAPVGQSKPPLATTVQDEAKATPAAAGQSKQEEAVQRQPVRKHRAVIDPDSGFVGKAHVFETDTDVFSAKLVNPDAAAGGTYTFQLQVIESDRKDSWVVFKKWVRVGENNSKSTGSSFTEFESASEAVASFQEAFLDRTKNEWRDRANFCKKPGAFHWTMPVPVDAASGLVNTAHVYETDTGAFSASLVKAEPNGKKSYHILQLLESEKQDAWWLFKKWRQGGEDRTRSSLRAYTAASEAKKDFQAAFLEKTQVEWDDREELQKQADFYATAGCYVWLAADPDMPDEDGTNPATPTASKVDPCGRKRRGIVDAESKLVGTAHVYETDRDVFAATLLRADVSGPTGQNSTYIIQLLESDKNDEWWVFKKWGRVGEASLGSSIKKYDSLSEAVADFERTFQEKTKNEWKNRSSFCKKSGAYNWLDVITVPEAAAAESLAPALLLQERSRLDPRVQELVRMIFDKDMLSQTMVELKLDTQKLPLGNLKIEIVEKAYRVLGEIASLLAERDKGVPEHRAQRLEAQIKDRSNQFYNLVPHATSQREQLPPIASPDALKAKTELLDALKDIEIAQRLMAAGWDAAASGGVISCKNQVDGYYDTLHTELRPVERGGEDWRLCEHYLLSTHADTHRRYGLILRDAFYVSREGEEARFAPSRGIPNHMLLWHGSRKSNYVGILSQGLRIAPPEAPVTGYMFGKGIYFANMSSKSANYCFCSAKNNVGLVLLSQVAVGRTHELVTADSSLARAPPGTQCVHGVGGTTPDPAAERTWGPDKIRVPCGKGVPSKVRGSTSLLYDEFIVYDVSQVVLRFLLKVEFDYGRGRN